MRKEILWAAIIGISFGLIVAFGIYRVNSSTKRIAVENKPTPKPPVVLEFKITLNKPENEDVVTESPLTVSGITKPLSWITFSGEEEDYIVQSDNQGVFSQDVELIPGVNQIKLTAFDANGNQSVQKVLIVYSSSFQTNKTSDTLPQVTTASETSSIKQKVQEKVAEAMNKPKAYLGTVTDITDTTIQIKTLTSEIRQISVNSDDVTVVRSTTSTNKTVKLTDIAIGDFIVAMGYINTNSVLSAQRILITNPVQEPKVDTNFVKITKVSNKTVDSTDLKDGTEKTFIVGAKTGIVLYENSKTVAYKLSALSPNDLILYVTQSNEDTIVTRKVFVIKGKES